MRLWGVEKHQLGCFTALSACHCTASLPMSAMCLALTHLGPTPDTTGRTRAHASSPTLAAPVFNHTPFAQRVGEKRRNTERRGTHAQTRPEALTAGQAAGGGPSCWTVNCTQLIGLGRARDLIECSRFNARRSCRDPRSSMSPEGLADFCRVVGAA